MCRNVVAQKPNRIARADDGAASDLKVHVRELPEMPDHGPLGVLAHLDFHRMPLAFGMNEEIYFRLLLRIPVKIEFSSSPLRISDTTKVSKKAPALVSRCISSAVEKPQSEAQSPVSVQ